MYREVAAYQTLQSESVPRVVDTNVERFDDLSYKMYLVTEYITGPTLAEYVVASGRICFEDALTLAIRVLQVVGDCHKSDIVHRDIKPDNLILRCGNVTDAVLIDFGLSFNTADDGELRTHLSEEIGNRFLRLPELSASSPSKRDPRSDVTFCAGLLVYAVTGHAPALLFNERRQMPHQREEIRAALEATVPASKRPALYRILDQSFDTDLSRRWQSAAELEIALETLRAVDHTSNATMRETWDRVNQYIAQPNVQARADAVKTLSAALAEFRSAQGRVAGRVAGHFGASQTGHAIDGTDGVAQTQLAIVRTGSQSRAPWITCRAEVRGDELVLSMLEGAELRYQYRTNAAMPAFSSEFRAAAEYIFLNQIAAQIE